MKSLRQILLGVRRVNGEAIRRGDREAADMTGQVAADLEKVLDALNNAGVRSAVIDETKLSGDWPVGDRFTDMQGKPFTIGDAEDKGVIIDPLDILKKTGIENVGKRGGRVAHDFGAALDEQAAAREIPGVKSNTTEIGDEAPLSDKAELWLRFHALDSRVDHMERVLSLKPEDKPLITSLCERVAEIEGRLEKSDILGDGTTDGDGRTLSDISDEVKRLRNDLRNEAESRKALARTGADFAQRITKLEQLATFVQATKPEPSPIVEQMVQDIRRAAETWRLNGTLANIGVNNAASAAYSACARQLAGILTKAGL